MDWLNKLIGMSPADLLNVSIPKEKMVQNIKSTFLQMALTRELENIQDIVYQAIFRQKISESLSEELHIIEVALIEPKYIKVIAEALQKAIPYPKIVIFSSAEKYLLFLSDGYEEKLLQYQFSDWVYEEELLADRFYGTVRDLDTPLQKCHEDALYALYFGIANFFDKAQYSEYICLRHMIDILKKRELQNGEDYVLPAISRLVNEDRVEYFGDMPFVLQRDADQQYQRIRGCPFGDVHIEDERFGIDRKFEPLRALDFTTQDEVMQILQKAEEAFFRPRWNHEDKYDDVDPDEFEDY